MCAMTENGVRGVSAISRSGRYLVCRGRHSGMDIYIPESLDDAVGNRFAETFKPRYAIRVKAKGYIEL